MTLYRNTTNYAAQEPRPGIYHHQRRWMTWRRSGKDLSVDVETIIKKPTPEFSLRFHVGGSWSETPFDGHLTILGTGFFWSVGALWNLADRIVREERHKYEGRDLQLSIHNGSLWWKAWVHPDTWCRGEFAAWRDSNIALNPLTILLGAKRYWYEDIETAELAVRMPEAEYPVNVTLQRQTFGRPKSSKRIASWIVDVEAPKGVPYRFDHSGGWKGDRVYGFSVNLRERRTDWQTDAQAAIEAWVLKHRAESGFREPQEAE